MRVKIGVYGSLRHGKYAGELANSDRFLQMSQNIINK